MRHEEVAGFGSHVRLQPFQLDSAPTWTKIHRREADADLSDASRTQKSVADLHSRHLVIDRARVVRVRLGGERLLLDFDDLANDYVLGVRCALSGCVDGVREIRAGENGKQKHE
jgi:hypothetical protein